MSRLAALGASAWYWLGLLLLAISMEGAALFFQYVLDYGPCMLCIHVRIWVFGLLLVALFTLAVRGTTSLLVAGHLLVGAIGIGLLERSWQLLGVERGTIEGMCTMDLGLPAWFALDSWFPTLFKAWEPCGYTPQLLFGITMAEVLVVLSVTLLATSLAFVIATLAARRA